MILDLLDFNWITVIGPNRARRILRRHRAEILTWTQTVYRDVLPDAVMPHSIYAVTPLENRFIESFAFLKNIAAGGKLIASHPANLNYNNDRAYSLISVCRIEKPGEKKAGKPYLLVDGAEITNTRTAAGALLFLSAIRSSEWVHNSRVAFIGCGKLARECARTLSEQCGSVREIVAFDTNPVASRSFCAFLGDYFSGESTTVSSFPTCMEAISTANIIFFCTTSKTPYFDRLEISSNDSVTLHLSLRDLAPQTIAGSMNVTDSADHVCTNGTSLDLLARDLKARGLKYDGFIFTTLTDLLLNPTLGAVLQDQRVIFSPFGLAVLDVFYACKIYECFLNSWHPAALLERLFQRVRN